MNCLAAALLIFLAGSCNCPQLIDHTGWSVSGGVSNFQSSGVNLMDITLHDITVNGGSTYTFNKITVYTISSNTPPTTYPAANKAGEVSALSTGFHTLSAASLNPTQHDTTMSKYWIVVVADATVNTNFPPSSITLHARRGIVTSDLTSASFIELWP